jgi:hypothetical protein
MNLSQMIEPHATALESCASAMEAAGIGCHPDRGHAALARRMAAHIRSEAALGRVSSRFDDNTMFAAADEPPTFDVRTKSILDQFR